MSRDHQAVHIFCFHPHLPSLSLALDLKDDLSFSPFIARDFSEKPIASRRHKYSAKAKFHKVIINITLLLFKSI
jgi:hypothetical protein